MIQSFHETFKAINFENTDLKQTISYDFPVMDEQIFHDLSDQQVQEEHSDFLNEEVLSQSVFVSKCFSIKVFFKSSRILLICPTRNWARRYFS